MKRFGIVILVLAGFVLSASAHMRDFDKKTYSISFDLKPALTEETGIVG